MPQSARGMQHRERFGFWLLAFCLMDKHAHLALERGKVALSRVMLLRSSYTQAFNRRLWSMPLSC